jgi:predicted nucleotidyltransferase
MNGFRRMDAEGREAVLARLAEAVAGEPYVAFAVVFGSFLDAEVFRDVDVGIWTTRDAPRFADVDLAASLSRLVGLPVDVRRFDDAPLTFRFHALRGRVLVVRDEELLAHLMERTAREYHDLAPLLRRATREAFAR